MSKREKWFHLELVARKEPTLVDSTFLESFRPGLKIGLLGIKHGFLGLKIGFQRGFGVSFAYHLQWCGFSLFTALVNLITLEIVRMWGFSRMEIGVNFEDMRALM